MRVHLYTIVWNERPNLEFFFRHYDPWVDRYVIYDDGSDDGTPEILRAHPRVEVRHFQRTDQPFALSQMNLSNTAWKESRGAADWVIVNDLDEHLYHPTIGDYLRSQRSDGVTAIPALGFEMVSGARGAPDTKWYSKLCLFDPDAVEEVRFGPGRHRAKPAGNIVYPEKDELILLHYRYLDLQRVLTRRTQLAQRLGPNDRENDLCRHWNDPADKIEKNFASLQTRSIDVLALREPALTHAVPWWRR